MLAAAGWPLAELFDRPLANLIGQQPIVDGFDRSPSVLNGGLDKISPVYWAGILLAASAIDLYQVSYRMCRRLSLLVCEGNHECHVKVFSHEAS